MKKKFMIHLCFEKTIHLYQACFQIYSDPQKCNFFDLTASSRKYSMDAFRLRCNHIYRIWSSGSICLHLNTWLVEFAQMISNWFRLLILYYAKVISNHIKWSPAPQSLINSYSDYLELILPPFNLAKVNIAEFVR